MSWFQTLQPASYGGVPFGVLGGQLRVGRRNAVHAYPFKDEVWVEDLGREARRITLVGFLVENATYGGGPVIGQRERMVAACETAGVGTLVHPTLGSLQVSLLEANFNERWEQGRVFEIAFSFIEGGQRTFPAAEVATGDVVQETCSAADFATAADFSSGITSALAAGAAVVNMAVSTVGAWAGQALALASDATNLMNTVAALPGSYGRFFGAGLRGISGVLAVGGSIVATVENLIALGTVARTAVSSACSKLSAAAASLGVGSAGSFASSAQAVPAALLTAAPDPGGAIRVLSGLANFTQALPTPNSAVGTSMATMQRACGDLFRRAAVVSVCRASASYQPSSFEDAVAVRGQVAALLDAEIQVAGDQGEDATYTALRALRAAVVEDLTSRGADLATLTTITTPLPMPALMLAQRVYRDAGRADELVVESGCVHPCFMPTSFKALAQ